MTKRTGPGLLPGAPRGRPPRTPRLEDSAAAQPFNDAFASLRDRLNEGHGPPPSEPKAAPAARVPSRAVVRLERKGRGGKEATIVEKLELGPGELARWADDLQRSLGCGGGVEGGAVVVQGDQRERVVRWLEGRGVRRVTRG